ncbi:Cytoskeleton-associated protein 2 [Channa argus]|uniref:Cytoskeleton-associated protein 2 n=1 Tax=Channa argus TaxID=215402 RepID=A0A6G1QXE2_CHAAH|nr:Cytoskeleton-associated protein 2 [Channa argus]
MLFFRRDSSGVCCSRLVELGRSLSSCCLSKHYSGGNKENAQPAHESKSYIKRDKTSAVPFQQKNNEKGETLTRNGPLKAQTTQVDTNSTSGDALKKLKPVQRSGKGAAAADFKQKVAAEALKPPAALPSSRSAPGMYKGKIVQSKIGSIWKSSASVGSTDSKSSVTKTENQMAGNVKYGRSKSVNDVPGTHKHESARSKSAFNKSTQVSKRTVTNCPLTGFCLARPLGKTVPLTQTSTSSRNTTVAPTKGNATHSSKAKITVSDKVNKPPISSTLSQYRLVMETAEERRAKLAEWLASKGKTLKRPAMTTAPPTKTRVCGKQEAEPKSQPLNEPLCIPKPKHSLKAPRPDSATTAHCPYTQEEVLKHSQTPVILDTTLELLENSQDRVDDVTDECVVDETEDDKSKDIYKKEKLQNDIQEDVGQQPKFEKVKNEPEESDVEETEHDHPTPEMKNASVIKYSVRTTPYLQSVKKTIEGEVSTSTRRKSNIKDLKFLTPVRRSCRIQGKTSHLPTMLVDHDPCVSSLAELVKLDDDPNAYIYRKNVALLGDLPDQSEL